MAPIDQVHLSFNPQTLSILNIVLGLVMFGVALELRVDRLEQRDRASSEP